MPRVANSKPSNFSPNTYHTCWSDRRLLVRASRPIEKGELITICKVPALLISVVWWERVPVGRAVKVVKFVKVEWLTWLVVNILILNCQ